jgi:LysR family transcriptional regulator, glycine cleavage system transcriptional activator
MNIPPFSALRCVEAVTRLGNVTRAASELNITQSAVSRQIIEFEKILGTQLFRRDKGRLEPTPAGRQLGREIAQAFRQLSVAIAAARVPQVDASLTISMLPSVATKWLAPRLMSFLRGHPDIEISVTTARHFVDFGRDRIDAAIRYGRGRWPGVEAHLLGGEGLFPVCSPDYAKALDLRKVTDLGRSVLLHGDLPEDWHQWCRHAGAEDLPIPRSLRFADDAALLEAAIRGHGVALGRSLLVHDDLRAGRLVAPFPHRIRTQFRYWFIWPSAIPEKKGRWELLEWLRTEFASCGEADP